MSRVVKASVMALCAALAAAACAPESMSPNGGIAASSVRADTRWRFNSQKYSDTGAHPATGRSGSAALAAEALILPNGSVQLSVTSYRAGDPSATAAGILDKVQVRIFDGLGRLLSTKNALLGTGNNWQTLLAGMPANGTVQVQANVKGIDGRRTDVVTVSNIAAVPAPDLAVLDLVLPGTALTVAPTVIGATIAETGGAHGARADCVLYVDNTEVDRSANIWVDAGDVVTCAFTRFFAATGTAQVRVALEHITPGDSDPSNNMQAAPLVVVAPSNTGAPSSFDGYVSSGTFTVADTFETKWTAPDGSVFLEQRNGSLQAGSLFAFNANAVIGTTVAFPITRLDIAENGDGRLLSAVKVDGLAATSSGSGVSCAVREPGDGTALYVCAYDMGFTSISFSHNAGTVTYQSTEYSKFWNGSSYDENTYVVNDTTTTGVFADVRSRFAINLQVTDGATLYVLNGSGPMSAENVNDVSPRQCVTSPVTVPPVTYAAATCFASAYRFTGFTGTLSGAGLSAQPAAALP